MMKLALTAFLLLAVVGCGGGSPTAPSAATTPAPAIVSAGQASTIAEQVGALTMIALRSGGARIGIKGSAPGRISTRATSGEIFSSVDCAVGGRITVVYIRDQDPAGVIDLSALKAVYDACTFMSATGSVQVSGELTLRGQYFGVGNVANLLMTGTLSTPSGASCAVLGTVNAVGAFSGSACGYSVTSVPPPLPPLPTPVAAPNTAPRPISPADGAVIPQNNVGNRCPEHQLRGTGLEITFTWSPPEVGNAVAYELYVIGATAIFPLVDQSVAGTSFTYLSCNGFVHSSLRDGWTWRVRAQDSTGAFGPWSNGIRFSFAPCVLADGTACRAPSGLIGGVMMSRHAISKAAPQELLVLSIR